MNRITAGIATGLVLGLAACGSAPHPADNPQADLSNLASPAATPTNTISPPLPATPKSMLPGPFAHQLQDDGLAPQLHLDVNGDPFVTVEAPVTDMTNVSITEFICVPDADYTPDDQTDNGVVEVSGWTCVTDSVEPSDTKGFASVTGGKILLAPSGG